MSRMRTYGGEMDWPGAAALFARRARQHHWSNEDLGEFVKALRQGRRTARIARNATARMQASEARDR